MKKTTSDEMEYDESGKEHWVSIKDDKARCKYFLTFEERLGNSVIGIYLIFEKSDNLEEFYQALHIYKLGDYLRYDNHIEVTITDNDTDIFASRIALKAIFHLANLFNSVNSKIDVHYRNSDQSSGLQNG